jgi:hypothetical protein
MSTLHGNLPQLSGAFTNAVEVVPAFQPGAFQVGAFQTEVPGYFTAVLPSLDGAFNAEPIPLVTGTFVGHLPAQGGAFVGAHAVIGELAGTLPKLTGALSGFALVTGELSGAVPSLTGSFGETVPVQHRGGGSAWRLPPNPPPERKWWEPQRHEAVAGSMQGTMPMPLAHMEGRADEFSDDEWDAIVSAVVTSVVKEAA